MCRSANLTSADSLYSPARIASSVRYRLSLITLSYVMHVYDQHVIITYLFDLYMHETPHTLMFRKCLLLTVNILNII